MEEKPASSFFSNTTEHIATEKTVRNPFHVQKSIIFVVASTCNTAHMSNNEVSHTL